MASSSTCQLHNIDLVDESYFLALHDDDEVIPISDEKYVEELQLQEALISSSLSLTASCSSSVTASIASCSSSVTASIASCSSSSQPPITIIQPPQPPQNICAICMDTKPQPEMFQNTKDCTHDFCTDCIRAYIAAKIKENITAVKCPDPTCDRVIGPQDCGTIVPKEVLERWEDILCESLIMSSEKFYCPFKDCSAMMVDDGGVVVTVSECPSCNRLFCAQCKVVWHCGMSCEEFELWKKGELGGDDNMLINLAKDKKWMRCSNCKFFVERVDGCLHMSCRCGHEFCYGCGEAYVSTHVCAAGRV
ncbi:E3 ubiquitin-protein ligase RSL1-like [Bidens hawaiensis]|uniref:E3 ubiquitin-protein ligase RSL1-like n=1 Tax=Bidens hawaiensis TaxID=980011 RepID=UPI004049E588